MYTHPETFDITSFVVKMNNAQSNNFSEFSSCEHVKHCHCLKSTLKGKMYISVAYKRKVRLKTRHFISSPSGHSDVDTHPLGTDEYGAATRGGEAGRYR